MAQAWCTGASGVHVAPTAISTGSGNSGGSSGASASPIFFGHGEKGARLQIRPEYSPVFVDITGDKFSYDDLYEGTEAYVSLDMTRFNYNTLQAQQARPRHNLAGAGDTPGLEVWGDVGYMAITEGGGVFTLWVQFPYAAKAAMTGLPPAFRFPFSKLIGPDDLQTGTAPHKVRCVWHCKRGYDPTTGKLLLYDNSGAGLPAIPPN